MNWCVIHGTPGQDPLTVQGPYDEPGAQEAAASAVEARPDVAAIADVMVAPDADPSDLKHGSYDPPSKLVAEVRRAAAALEAEAEKLVPALDRRNEERVLQEVAAFQRTGSTYDEPLFETLQRLKLLRARVGAPKE